jgi:hypothetical protein
MHGAGRGYSGKFFLNFLNSEELQRHEQETLQKA